MAPYFSTQALLFLGLAATPFCVNALSLPVAPRNAALGVKMPLAGRSITDNVRVLGVGSSSTDGTGSSTMDGYRLELRRLLEEAGHTGDFTGPICSGEMEGGHHAGAGGDTIGQIKDRALADDGWKRFAPNVILINAGSNNCNDDGTSKEDVEAEMRALIDSLITPDVVILVSLLHKMRTDKKNECIGRIGGIFKNIVAGYDSSKVQTVDHFEGLDLAEDDYFDAIHVNDKGYVKMAQMFFDAMNNESINMSPPAEEADAPSC